MSTTTCAPSLPTPSTTWLWPNLIPLGKITLLAGDPGIGKSFLSLDLAARLSTASPMPHQPPSPCHPVTESPCHLPPSLTLLLSSEDELHDTILPRLAAQNANPKYILPLRCLNAQNPSTEPFSLKHDLPLLNHFLETAQHSIKLLILNPITAFMQGIDQNSTSQVRQHFTPLAQLAAQHQIAILAITHLNKQTHRQNLYRATGSLALAAIARTVLLVHPSPCSTHNLLTQIKSNLAAPTNSLPFRITNNHLEWLPPTPSPSNSPLSTQDSALPTSHLNLSPDPYFHHDLQSARDFLLTSLTPGPQPAIPLIRQAKQLAISERTLKRAKAQLGIQSQKLGLNEWHWLLPDSAPMTQSPTT